MKISIIIPAKGTSQRLKNKNLLKLDGKTLVYRACEKCLRSDYIDNVYVDTESENILSDLSPLTSKGLKVINRPKEMADNRTSGNDLIVFEQTQIEKSDLILHTYATSPMITVGTIDKVIRRFLEEGQNYDSFFTANYLQEYLWVDNSPYNFSLEGLPNSNDLPDNILVETHGLYGIRDEALTKYKRRLGESVLPVLIPREESLDINYSQDYELLEVLWKNRK